MFETNFNCPNDYRRPPPVITIPPTILVNHMKRRRHVSLSSTEMMINDDQKYPIELMQSPTPPAFPSAVNHLQSSSLTIYDNDHQHLPVTEQASVSFASQIRFGLRSFFPLDDRQRQLFEQIFSSHEQTTNIAECIFKQTIFNFTTNSIKTFILLAGPYHEISQLQNTLISLTIARLYRLVNEQNRILRITLQEFSSETTRAKSLLLPSESSSTCPLQTSTYLHRLCANHQSHPLLITFHLYHRSSNTSSVQFHLLCTNDQTTHDEQISPLLLSLSLSIPSIRQKQSFHLSNHESIAFATLRTIFNEYVINIEQHLLYIFATSQNEKQLKSYAKIQRLLKSTRNRFKMSAMEAKEEIWVDGPLSKNEIWIDGPRSTKVRLQRSTPKHRPRPMYTKAKLSLRSSPCNFDDSTFDTESIVSSHCHLPVLPVFKDHSLLPFRSNQTTLPRSKPPINESSKVNFKLSTNKLNDDLEMLEKTLETLLVPSPIVPNPPEMTQSLNRMEQLSSSMTNDEKNKRLSRIVSPTRFDKILTPEHVPPSVPCSPFLLPKNRQARTPNRSVPPPTKKPKVPVRTTSLAETTPRPSIFQRLFGLRSSINSPPLSPLTVTLDSHDDLMPLTTSSTASSGRASSSGYESMSNTVLEEMMVANGTNSIRVRNKSARKEDRRMNSPIIQHQQRLTQLKHRHNELKLELAMTRTFLLMDKNKNFENNDSITSNSPMRTLIPNTYQEEDELEQEIEHLERRLACAKSQLTKNKPFKS